MLVFQKDYSQLARLEPLVLNLISLRLAFMVFFRVFFVWATGTWWKASGGPALFKIKSKQKHCGDNTYNVVFTGHYKNGGKGT